MPYQDLVSRHLLPPVSDFQDAAPTDTASLTVRSRDAPPDAHSRLSRPSGRRLGCAFCSLPVTRQYRSAASALGTRVEQSLLPILRHWPGVWPAQPMSAAHRLIGPDRVRHVLRGASSPPVPTTRPQVASLGTSIGSFSQAFYVGRRPPGGCAVSRRRRGLCASFPRIQHGRDPTRRAIVRLTPPRVPYDPDGGIRVTESLI